MYKDSNGREYSDEEYQQTVETLGENEALLKQYGLRKECKIDENNPK